jgi:hypothetical protein
MTTTTTNHSVTPQANGPSVLPSSSDLKGLLEAAKMEDGLLTRAEFLEVILLAMKKVDPELIVALREGFDHVTLGGSIDRTRKEWVDAAAAKADAAAAVRKEANRNCM